MFTAWKHFVITIGLVLALTLSWSSTAKSEKTVIGYSAVSAITVAILDRKRGRVLPGRRPGL